MADLTNAGGPKNAGAKPRLSLISSKQSTRLKSEDSPPEQPDLHLNLQNSIHYRTGDHVAGTSNDIYHNDNDELTFNDRRDMVSVPNNGRVRLTEDTDSNLAELEPKLAGSNWSSGETKLIDTDKTSVCKEDLIRLLSMMKSELQSKNIAIASMKLEQLKRLMNPVEISRSALASTYTELQDRLKANYRCKNGGYPKSINLSATPSALKETKLDQDAGTRLCDKTEQVDQLIKDSSQNGEDKEDENLTLLNTLLELLDRHPLLALPRDSLYCLDYNCNELSTKNYLNLKIQHLENLIDQHRRFRYFVGERLKRSEQRYLDLTLKIEQEKNLKMESERSTYRNEGKTLLLKHIDQIKEALEKEKASKYAIVMTLLNELMDERERNEKLNQRVLELEEKLSEKNKTTKPTQVKHQQSSPTTGQQAICKPRVPAKPAQLLDRQRSHTNNR